jgi:hypothetical protein
LSKNKPLVGEGKQVEVIEFDEEKKVEVIEIEEKNERK